MKRRSRGGFSLIEVMIAMSILAGVLVWNVVRIARSIQSENHAKLMTTATFLARSKMNDLEDDLYEKGFGEFEKELAGSFEDRGFARFGWKVTVDKVELPSQDQVQSVLGHAGEAKAAITGQEQKPDSTATQDPITSSVAAMSSQFGLLKEVLEGGIRRLTVSITWLEGTRPYDVTVVAYYTDPRRVDQAINMTAVVGAAEKLSGSSSSTSSTTSTSSTSSTSSTKK